MKKVIFVALCGLLAVQANAQTSSKAAKAVSKEAVAATDKDKEAAAWPQLTAFHKIMAQTFHPAEKGDFKPIRKRSGEMMDAMKALIGNPFPEAYRTSDMKVAVANLEGQVMNVRKMVEANAGDTELMEALTQTHDVFHKIAGMCTKDGDHHDH